MEGFAARLYDMHVCPLATPMLPPIPHVGGPIMSPGSPTVLIGDMQAARATDMAICVGPPDAIAMGSSTVMINDLPAARMGDPCMHGGKIISGWPTVIIGDGGGAGTGQGNTMATAKVSGKPFTQSDCASQNPQQGQQSGKPDAPTPPTPSPTPTKSSWIEVATVDADGKPLAYQRYIVTGPDGIPQEGFTGLDGLARVPVADPGSCKISLPDLDGRSWRPA